MSRVFPPPALLCAALLAVGVLSSGCSTGDSFGDADEWIATACGDGAETTDDFDIGSDLEEFSGGPRHQRACETDEGDLVQAFQFDADPAREFLNIGDGWESGDGSTVEWATKELDDDEWIGIYVHRAGVGNIEGEPLLEPLEDEGFEVSNND